MADQSILSIMQKAFLSILLLIISSGLTLSATSPTNTVLGQSQNPSILTNTPHPKIPSNATTQTTIISNTTHLPITSAGTVNSSSLLSNTPHPKIPSNTNTPLPKLNATNPTTITNSSLLSNTPHPKVLSNSTK